MFVPGISAVLNCMVFSWILWSPSVVRGHGSMIDPPQRGIMWKYGFNTPKNYNFNELNCGGFRNQWQNNGGKCGLCGDPFDGERTHEDGGLFATGIISKTYISGSTIQVKVKLTANHQGWYEFRLCDRNTREEVLTQTCLNRHLLQQPEGDTRYYPRYGEEDTVTLVLPEGVTCRRCVLQWKYNAGNNWGCSGVKNCCMGCGAQEQFLNCADVAISKGKEDDERDEDRQEKPKVHKTTQLPPIVFRTSVQIYNFTDSKNIKSKDGKENMKTEETTNVDKRHGDYVKRNFDIMKFRKSVEILRRSHHVLTPYKRFSDMVRFGPSRIVVPKVIKCQGFGIWKTVSGMDKWCRLNCGTATSRLSSGCHSHCVCSM